MCSQCGLWENCSGRRRLTTGLWSQWCKCLQRGLNSRFLAILGGVKGIASQHAVNGFGSDCDGLSWDFDADGDNSSGLANGDGVDGDMGRSKVSSLMISLAMSLISEAHKVIWLSGPGPPSLAGSSSKTPSALGNTTGSFSLGNDSDSLPEMQASSSPVASKSDWSDLSSETSIMLTFLSECWGEVGEVLTKGDMCPLWESWGPTVVMISGPLWSKSESTSQTITMVWSWHRGQWSPKPSESKLPSSLSHETTRLTWSKEIRLGTVRLLSLCNRWHRSWTLKQWVRVRFYIIMIIL